MDSLVMFLGWLTIVYMACILLLIAIALSARLWQWCRVRWLRKKVSDKRQRMVDEYRMQLMAVSLDESDSDVQALVGYDIRVERILVGDNDVRIDISQNKGAGRIKFRVPNMPIDVRVVRSDNNDNSKD